QHAVRDERAHDAGGRLRPQGEALSALRGEGVHLLLDDVGVLADRALEERGVLDDGHADLLVSVLRKQLARTVLQPLPGADLGGQHVVHATDRLDLDRQLNLPSSAARRARARRLQSGTARYDRAARNARSMSPGPSPR